uniref:xanthine dehydrogenase n=1 Tax=Saccoglossus kowalevskii TaxID=10224 RepID=A0ABM0LW08_SACKO|nr:PREDICTED: xanthine dehydrogenase/oxidase-like [Saccoglossus kowalevskii]
MQVVDKNVDPEMTLLTYLRTKLNFTGTKLGCAEGGCGACTVMISKYSPSENQISHYSVNACLSPVCAVHGLAVTTVEGIGSTKTRLHPVQERIAKAHGSQCGFCTPGIVMSMYTLLRNNPQPSYDEMMAAFEGNLCRCTGYRPIIQGYKTFTKEYCCGDAGVNGCCQNQNATTQQEEEEMLSSTKLYNANEFVPFDPTQEPIFPPELKNHADQYSKTVQFCSDRLKWIRPVSIDEILDLKAQYPDAKLINGNTEVGVEVKFKNQHYPVLLTPSHIPELKRVEITDTGVVFGASVSLSVIDKVLKNQIESLPEYKTGVFSAIVEMLRWFAGPQVRNVSAIGGNIITASPISDLNPLLMAAGCKLTLISRSGTRNVVMNDTFFTGYRKTLLEKEEILLFVHIPHTRQDEYFYGYKQSPRREDDIAIVNAGMRVIFEPGTHIVREIALSFGGMAPTTVLATKTMKALVGRKWEENMLDDICELLKKDLQLSPSAPGGMIEYRKTLTASFFFKFYLTVMNKLHAKEVIEASVPSSYKTTISPLQRDNIKSSQLYQEVADGQPADDAVGRPLVHLSAFKQTTGEAIYCDDIPPINGELYLAFVTSTKAHAKIRSIKSDEATCLDGVHAFITYKDVPGSNSTGVAVYDEEVFASEKVVCVGQIIGAIVADDKAIAQRAAKQVIVHYDELDPIITIEDAISKESYFNAIHTIARGNVQEGFEMSDHVIDGEVRLGGQEHFYLEANAAIAIPKGEDGEMEIISSSQNPTLNQKLAAKALGVPQNRIVAKVKRLGGGFGGKETRCCMYSTCLAVAAHRVGKPVRFMMDRDEDMCMSGFRHPFLARYKVGFNNNGKIQSIEIDLYSNAGCSLDLSASVMDRALYSVDGCYMIPNIRTTGYPCKTNIASNTAFRGFGGPQGMFVMEHIITDIAYKCNISQHRIREINMYKEGDLTHYNQTFITNNSLDRCWKECLQKSDYQRRKRQVDMYNSENRWKKRGISIIPTKYGISFTFKTLNQTGALVQVYTDGSVLIAHGGTEMGQGLHTKMIQVASRALNIPVNKIFISETSTNTVPNTSPTAASSGSDLNGQAVKIACDKILQRLNSFVLSNPKGSWEDWVTAAYLDRVSLSATGFYKVPDIGHDMNTNTGHPFSYFTVGVGCSEVEIDCLTGDHHVIRTDIVMDLGQSLNPAIDIGQIEGAFMQGYGLFTIEDLRWSPNGTLLTRGPGMYKIPSFGDVPTVFNVSLLANCPNKHAIYSSKAVGEPPLFLASSVFFGIKYAIMSARADAGITNIFCMDSPATAEHIRMACQDQFTSKFPPAEPGTYVPWFIRM